MFSCFNFVFLCVLVCFIWFPSFETIKLFKMTLHLHQNDLARSQGTVTVFSVEP